MIPHSSNPYVWSYWNFNLVWLVLYVWVNLITSLPKRSAGMTTFPFDMLLLFNLTRQKQMMLHKCSSGKTIYKSHRNGKPGQEVWECFWSSATAQVNPILVIRLHLFVVAIIWRKNASVIFYPKRKRGWPRGYYNKQKIILKETTKEKSSGDKTAK